MRYTKPEMEVIRFNETDVIAASTRTITWSNTEDGNSKNNLATFGNYSYTVSSSSSSDYNQFRADLASYFGDPTLEDAGRSNILFGSNSLNRYTGGTSITDGDGTFVYDGKNGNNWYFSRKQ